MPRVITSLCLREGSCQVVCPVECIVPGKPVDRWPTYYIDADTCIDCGACESECPHHAIFPMDEVPSKFKAKGGEVLSMPEGSEGYDAHYSGENHEGEPVKLKHTRKLAAGEIIDLTPAIEINKSFFKDGPGYNT